MTLYPQYTNPTYWNGPICPSCGRGYIHGTSTTTTFVPAYRPKHRKEGPAQ